MKSFITVATMISLAAGSSVMAQAIQESFHSVTAQLCVESFEEADNLVTINTSQQLLFNSFGAVTLIIDEQRRELEQTVVISFYVDQTTGDFTLLKTFEDGVTCMITEGIGFEPYVD